MIGTPLQRFFASYYEISPEEYPLSSDYIGEFTGDKPARYRSMAYPDGTVPGDNINHYSINSYGYRSEEFDSKKDAVIAGCSNTFGIGLPYEEIWGVSLCNTLGLSFDNLGMAGLSTQKTVANLMAYIKTYGKPEYIFCLFPNFARASIPLLNRFHLARDLNPGDIDSVDGRKPRMAVATITLNNLVPKMIKRPFYVEDTMNIETAAMQSIQAIQAFSMYCKEAGIKFIWSTWADSEETIYEWLVEEGRLEDYIPIDNRAWPYDYDNKIESYTKGSCHTELLEKYGHNFHIATDGVHPGIHRNAHIAEAFLEKVKSM